MRLIPLELIVGLLVSSSLAAGQEHSTPKMDQLQLLSKGIKEWNTWRAQNSNVEIDLRGAFLYHSTANVSEQVPFGFEEMPGGEIHAAQFREANFQFANLENVTLITADLRDADLRNASLTGAAMHLADLTNANLEDADLTLANMLEANLTGANLSGAELFAANLTVANLANADLTKASLKNTALNEANLKNAILVDTVLSETDLRLANLDKAVFEPKTLPDARLMVGARGLRNLRVRGLIGPDETFAFDIGAIVGSRKLANEAGLRALERDLTCAIERIRNGNPDRPWYARTLYFIAFDLTCEYGAEPIRPFFLMLMSALGFSVVYTFLLRFSRSSQLRVDFLPNFGGKEMSALLYPRKLPVKTRHKGRISTLVKYSRLPRIALYFSMQSIFNIGYREFNIGSWLGRLQRRQYAMRARGPLRLISGLQSLLGVYLLALWILCTFGRPFG